MNPGDRVLVAEEDVLGDGEAVDDVELLVHRRDAEVERGGRAGDGDRLALPEDLALVGAVGARQHLDERGLAGTVLAEQAVHLAGANVEGHALERVHPGEGLLHPANLEQRRRMVDL